MNHKYRFAAGAVTQLQQSLDEIPPCAPTELSKQQMIHALAPQILALRTKGYSWTAVAAMLSERGLPVSVAALRTHLRRVRQDVANNKEHLPKRSRGAKGDATAAPAVPVKAHAGLTTGGTATVLPATPLATSTSAPSSAPSPVGTKEQRPRNPGFYVRPDTKDI
jgi:hypothetical protein